MSSVIHYRFKNVTSGWDQLLFEGSSLSAAEVKRQIIAQKKLNKQGGGDFELVISNAQTNDDFSDAQYVSKNTSVLVRRVPVTKAKPLISKLQEEETTNTTTTTNNVVAPSISPAPSVIAAAVNSTLAPQRSSPQPRVSAPASSAAVLPVPSSSSTSNNTSTRLQHELLCPLCHNYFHNAMVVPCCFASFCDECIRQSLLWENSLTCPNCQTHPVTVEQLKPNTQLQKAVDEYLTGKEKERKDHIQRSKPHTQQPVAAQQSSVSMSVSVPSSSPSPSQSVDEDGEKSSVGSHSEVEVTLIAPDNRGVNDTNHSHNIRQQNGVTHSQNVIQHPSSVTLNNSSQNNKKALTCHRCGEPGHKAAQCPNRNNPALNSTNITGMQNTMQQQQIPAPPIAMPMQIPDSNAGMMMNGLSMNPLAFQPEQQQQQPFMFPNGGMTADGTSTMPVYDNFGNIIGMQPMMNAMNPMMVNPTMETMQMMNPMMDMQQQMQQMQQMEQMQQMQQMQMMNNPMMQQPGMMGMLPGMGMGMGMGSMPTDMLYANNAMLMNNGNLMPNSMMPMPGLMPPAVPMQMQQYPPPQPVHRPLPPPTFPPRPQMPIIPPVPPNVRAPPVHHAPPAKGKFSSSYYPPAASSTAVAPSRPAAQASSDTTSPNALNKTAAGGSPSEQTGADISLASAKPIETSVHTEDVDTAGALVNGSDISATPDVAAAAVSSPSASSPSSSSLSSPSSSSSASSTSLVSISTAPSTSSAVSPASSTTQPAVEVIPLIAPASLLVSPTPTSSLPPGRVPLRRTGWKSVVPSESPSASVTTSTSVSSVQPGKEELSRTSSGSITSSGARDSSKDKLVVASPDKQHSSSTTTSNTHSSHSSLSNKKPRIDPDTDKRDSRHSRHSSDDRNGDYHKQASASRSGVAERRETVRDRRNDRERSRSRSRERSKRRPSRSRSRSHSPSEHRRRRSGSGSRDATPPARDFASEKIKDKVEAGRHRLVVVRRSDEKKKAQATHRLHPYKQDKRDTHRDDRNNHITSDRREPQYHSSRDRDRNADKRDKATEPDKRRSSRDDRDRDSSKSSALSSRLSDPGVAQKKSSNMATSNSGKSASAKSSDQSVANGDTDEDRYRPPLPAEDEDDILTLVMAGAR